MLASHDIDGFDYTLLEQELSGCLSDETLFKAIVDAPFQFKVQTAMLFLGIIVLLQLNKDMGEIDRVALSDTELATRTTETSVVPFHNIKVGIDTPDNVIAEAIRSGKPQETTDWQYLFNPALRPEDARFNQASAGIAYSSVMPLRARDGGALIFSYFQYQHSIGEPQHDFMKHYAAIVDQQLMR